MNPVKVFWSEPTRIYRQSLRRFSKIEGEGTCPANPAKYSYHNASVVIGEREADQHPTSGDRDIAHDDPRWPTRCSCGYAFTPADDYRVNYDRLYEAKTGPSVGSRFTLRDAPPGAMWDAEWMRQNGGDWATGPDGLCLTIQLPNGHAWSVDAEASNCTRPQSVPVDGKPGWTRFVRTHYCWIRHGDPRTGDVHVDKAGDTCAAGAGSILAGDYHGFLHNGYLVSC